MRRVRIVAVCFVAAVLVACGTTPKKEPESAAVEEKSLDAAALAAAREPGMAGRDIRGGAPWTEPGAERYGAAGAPMGGPDSPWSSRVIYFEFDSANLRPEDQPVIEAHAAYLAKHPNAKLVIEGHADERGSREYNLALGERRAVAVRELLLVLGASGTQVEVVSYGEEKPAAVGQNEEAWRLNRRAELVYQGV